MKPVPSYISELLYEYECVIMPGFGGFITSYAPAKIHPVHHTFTPPSKDILFNANLKRNDGLLASRIAEAGGVTYSDALEHIRIFVSECTSRMSKKEEVTLTDIGVFSLNDEGAIQFRPDTVVNYLADAYGLTKFVSPPIRRAITHTLPEVRFTDRRPRPGTKRPARILRQAALILLPLAAIGLWSYFNSGAITDLHKNYSDVLSFTRTSFKEFLHSQAATEQESGLTTAQLPGGMTASKTLDWDKTPAGKSQPAIVNAPTGNVPTATTAPPESADATVQPSPAPHTIWYTMAGAFREPSNATTLISNLKARGYNAVLVDITRSGLRRVAYQAFNNEEEALHLLQTIRTSENPDAWILKK
jgi:nucleoid DNA-binding protein